jgi:alkylation response protein AidB-like acyl-CoA dehydrogenase
MEDAMQIYDPPNREFRFVLETLGYDEKVGSLPPFSDYDLEMVMSLIEQTGVFAKEQMLPRNRTGDQQGLKLDAATGAVTTPEGFTDIWEKHKEGGYGGVLFPPEVGGSGGPITLGAAFNEYFVSGNKSFSMVLGLTHALGEALLEFGTDEQKEKWLAPLIAGDVTGTMCLTEPQCGTDLGLITTKAIPQDDGSYKLTGNKIWITFGDHEFTDNILHLVLARLPDAPPGIKGISSFIVPKLNADGSRNPITVTGLEHKMGIHASPTCVMSMEDATGFLVGEPHKGMRTMFVMMNAARLLVGIEGIALSEIAYQTALAFAKDRRQSRSLDPAKNEANEKADNILVHPDVRRMLLNVKCTNEAMRALACWTAMNIDISHHSDDDEKKQQADDLVALLTPIVKSFCSERGFLNISESMQVTGGAGYTTDWSIEQYLRDCRIAMIYEGTNHIQALDLVGRKLPKAGGRLYQTWAAGVQELLDGMEEDEATKDLHKGFKAATDTLHEMTMTLGMRGVEDPEFAAATASNYLKLFCYVVLAEMWVRMAKEAHGREGDYYRTREKLARYYFDCVLPEMRALKPIINAGKDGMMGFSTDEL